MKYAKSAAIVAGTVVAIGAAAPAFATTTPAPPRTRVNSPLTDALQGKQDDVAPLVKTVRDTAKTVKAGPRNLLRGNKVNRGGPGLLLGGLQIPR
ncbi:hypothetical protein [Streptomyces chattanoogensis]|uniref:Secreted protein n=1 Tax=Streptomyces chattanoogensis TaxID=66876 RepID=A0A0N0Y0S8_9ACTN|nr:hypothetical protein [Streptomyces chattanoogensis]KPC66037.1 hypothetical protein ADL29_06330 [Streptomyces chattanoogensis]